MYLHPEVRKTLYNQTQRLRSNIVRLELERAVAVVFDQLGSSGPSFFSFRLPGPEENYLKTKFGLKLSADLVRFGLLVLGHSGRDVGNYFTDISNSFSSTFTEYQTLTFLEKLWMFDKSESFHMKSDHQRISSLSL